MKARLLPGAPAVAPLHRNKHIRLFMFWMTLLILLYASEGIAAEPRDIDLAREILKDTGVAGGVVVHVGCGDGRLTAALCAGESFQAQGLDADAQHVDAARQYVESTGRYGQISIHPFFGRRLPYIDNMVNLLVVSGPLPVVREEVLRVLCPGGKALVLAANGDLSTAERIVKPWSVEIDEWTHYLHDATGNSVARDTTVGPPRHLQWVGSPTWTRHHDHMSSFTAMVSAGGRVFYIMDEGLRSEIQLPPKWTLTARDAFNGTILWRRAIDDWHTHLWPLKSGPAQLPRRLVAVGDKVFVTLGLDAPLAALDAATGETIRVYEETRATEEILYSGGVLLLVVNEKPISRPWNTVSRHTSFDQLRTEPEAWAWKAKPRQIVAVAGDSGELLWKKTSAVAPLTLAADSSGVFFHDGDKIVCLDRTTGRQKWASQPIVQASDMRSWFAPTLVVSGGAVVFAGGEKIVRHRGGKDTMTALSAETGELLWTAEHPPSGYDSPEDVLIIDGLVWDRPADGRPPRFPSPDKRPHHG